MVLYPRSGDDIDRGLIGHWKLDDKKNGSNTAIDLANFNDGTIIDATNSQGINGLNADAMFFDYTNENMIQIGRPEELEKDFGEISLCSWFKHGGSGATKGILGKLTLWYLGNSSTGITFRHVNVGGGITNISAPIITNKWHHVVATYNGSCICIYFDGKLISCVDQSGSLGTNTADIGLGNISGSLTQAQWYDGSLSNIRVYDRTLTDGEVSKLYRLKL